MFKRVSALVSGAALALALTVSAGAAQDGPRPITNIEVAADLTSIGNREAAEFWRNMPGDLQEALVQELFDVIGPGGFTMVVAVDELSLAQAFDAGMTGDGARLVGEVQLIDPAAEEGTPPAAIYGVSASAREAEAMLPPGTDVTVISRTSREFYEAAVEAFARGVAQAVRGGA
jgi:hypothetical protein